MLYIDFDGVIFNTTEIVNDLLERYHILGYGVESHEFLRNYDYGKILKEATEMKGALESLRELLQLVGYKKCAILTRVNSMNEALIKYKLVQRELYGYAFLPVPIRIDEKGIYHFPKKTDYVIAKGNILVDDDQSNIDDWIQEGGNGIYFTESPKEGYLCVDNLQQVKQLLMTR